MTLITQDDNTMRKIDYLYMFDHTCCCKILQYSLVDIMREMINNRYISRMKLYRDIGSCVHHMREINNRTKIKEMDLNHAALYDNTSEAIENYRKN